MLTGKKLLKQMLQAGKSVRVIVKALGKMRGCVRIKIARLDIEVVVYPEIYCYYFSFA